MNIKYLREMSDLHLEFGPFQIPSLPTDHETVLLLAGDIHVGNRALRSGWMKELSQRFAYVLYVLGNHEHYTSSLDRTPVKIQDEIHNQCLRNVFLLDNNSFVIPGTNWKVIGGTCWTDFNRGHPVTMWHAQQTMMDYKKIRTQSYQRRLTPEWILKLHREFTAYAREELAKDDHDIIMMTHHAPHMLSADSIYSNDYHGNACYHSDLSDLILDHPRIKFWFHGHMHNNSNYMIGDDCNVRCMPRGYYGHELNDDFDPTLVLQLQTQP